MRYVIEGLEHDLRLKPRLNLRRVYLELTTRCNYRCPFCFRHAMTEPEGDMDKATFERFLWALEEMPEVEEVVLGGMGEPLLHPEALRIMSILTGKGYRVQVSTNGSLIDDDVLSRLVDWGVSKVSFSIDLAEMGHPQAERVLGIMEKVSHEVMRKQADRPVVAAEIVLSTQNVSKLPQLADKMMASGVTEVVLSNLLPVVPQLVPFVLYDGKFVAYRDAFDDFLRRATARMAVNVPNFELLTERHCAFVEAKATVVSWRGTVHPCYRFLHDGVEYVLGRRKEVISWGFGSLQRQGLGEIWLSKDYAYFRYKVRNALFPSCSDCKLREVCQFVGTTERDCWGNSPSCADCLWWRGIIACP